MWARIDGLRTVELGTPGEMRAQLNALVLAGSKQATAGLMELDYVAESEELEHVGEHLVLLDDHGGEVARIEVTGVEIVRFDQVTWEFAQAEGEGFGSIEHWREAHRRYWEGEGHPVDDSAEVVCLSFRLVPAPRLAEVTPANVDAAIALRVRPDQETAVAPVVVSLAEAYASRATAWPRLVYDGDRLVAFVMASFDPDHESEADRCGLWRLNVAAEEQGKGYGRFAVQEVCAEARRRGHPRIFVSWVPHPNGPEEFYLRLGFLPTGALLDGEIVAELAL